MARVVLAMSGGVDSSVAAHLLVEQGHDVIGVFMRHGHHSPLACNTLSGEALPASRAVSAPASFPHAAPGSGTSRLAALPIVDRLDHKQGCCTAADAADARRVADRLAIPFYALNLNQDFARIIDYFVDEYAAGRTPNPCVQCNNWIKFGKLFDYADSVGAEFVATGHYAQVTSYESQVASRGVPALGAPCAPHPALFRGLDGTKDQSYVLFGIDRSLLNRMLLPIGRYEKATIRQIAASLGLNVAAKKDSQEICFVSSGHYGEFIRQRRRDAGQPPADGGELVLTTGEVVGTHDGIERFTVGQRKRLGVALGDRKFVVRIEPQSRRVVLGDRSELGRTELVAAECNWLVDPDELPRRGQVQIRYNAAPAAASIERAADGRLHVRFDEPQFGVAPGQAAVCFQGDRVLGGGWIE